MEAVVGLVLMLLGVCQSVEMSCDGRQDGAQCYGALGGTVVLRLMDNAAEISAYTLEMDQEVILKGQKDKITKEPPSDRFSFTPNKGTMRINNLSRDDVGNYTLKLFSNGKNTGQRTLQLNIQAVTRHLPIIGGILSALLFLLIVGVAVYCAHKKKENSKPKDGDDNDLTYADISIVQRQQRQTQTQRRDEPEVEYGQIKVSQRPQQAAPPVGNDCVYAMVQINR